MYLYICIYVYDHWKWHLKLDLLKCKFLTLSCTVAYRFLWFFFCHCILDIFWVPCRVHSQVHMTGKNKEHIFEHICYMICNECIFICILHTYVLMMLISLKKSKCSFINSINRFFFLSKKIMKLILQFSINIFHWKKE